MLATTLPAEHRETPERGGARNNAKYVRGRARRRTRWARRQVQHRLLDWIAGQAGTWEIDGRRQAGCGRCSIDGTVELHAAHGDDGPNAYPVGVQSCGSVWACPPCAAKIRARRSIEVQLAASRHTDAGGTLAMLTLTVRHNRGHDLEDLVVGLREAWRSIQRRSRYRPAREAMAGTITALEVTQGPNGWHPHLHLLLLLDGDGGQVLDDLHEWLPEAWRHAVARRLDVAPDLAHGVHLMRLGADSAAYIAKIGDETTRADLKTDARSPFALLDAVEDGEAEAVARWLAYCRAMKGRRSIVWSDGLRARLLPDVEDHTDEELAALDVDGQVLEVVEGATWFGLAMRRTTAGVVQAVAMLEAWEDRLTAPVGTLAAGVGAVDPRPPGGGLGERRTALGALGQVLDGIGQRPEERRGVGRSSGGEVEQMGESPGVAQAQRDGAVGFPGREHRGGGDGERIGGPNGTGGADDRCGHE